MTVLILERIPGKVRGELTRWMLEVADGVFVNRLSPTVRESLWDLVCRSARPRTAAVLLFAPNADQGFTLRYHGKPTYQIGDFDGLFLVRSPS